MRINGHMDGEAVIQPVLQKSLQEQGLLMPYALVNVEGGANIPLTNVGNNNISLSLGLVVGVAHEVDTEWNIENPCLEEDLLTKDLNVRDGPSLLIDFSMLLLTSSLRLTL